MTTDTIALVTGATRGIGHEIARRLAEAGATVLLGARDPERGRAAAARLAGDVHAVALDVTDQRSIEAAVAAIDAEYGRLDALVNNAGVLVDWERPPTEVTVEQLRATFEPNVFGVVAMTNTALPLLRRSPAPRIVNLASTLGSLQLSSDPSKREYGRRMLAYNSSKTALNALTVMYANELREQGVRVLAVSPGPTATDLNGHTGRRSVQDGADLPARLALQTEGPTGVMLTSEWGAADGEPVPW
jgi:NAD(P)-dependent dehydrogenase (short-subunit alcohol dehydrogenase family)